MQPNSIHTLLAQKPCQILSFLHELSNSTFTGRDYTFLFALSANFDQHHELERVVDRLGTLRRTTVKGNARMVGCLSGPVSGIELPGGTREGLSCAVAVFDSNQCVPFYSDLQGRRETQVGRWHSFRRKASDNEDSRLDVLEARDGRSINWDEVWNNRSSSNKKDLLPGELRAIPPSDIHTVLYMTIPHPDSFTQALSDYFSPSTSVATSLGLVAAPTHFVTGRDVTLFFDDRIYGNGTVGLALVNSKDEKEKSAPHVVTEFVGLERLGKKMIVTDAEGNMINSLDDSNPTQLLLRAIEGVEGLSNQLAHTFREDEQFALAVLSRAGEILRTLRITAGDPSSRGGSISLDAAEAPMQGSIVQFIRRPPHTPVCLPSSLSFTKPSIAYLKVPESSEESSQISSLASDRDPFHLSDTFLATSTSGFLLSQFGRDRRLMVGPSRSVVSNVQEDRWLCSLSGGMAQLNYHRE